MMMHANNGAAREPRALLLAEKCGVIPGIPRKQRPAYRLRESDKQRPLTAYAPLSRVSLEKFETPVVWRLPRRYRSDSFSICHNVFCYNVFHIPYSLIES